MEWSCFRVLRISHSWRFPKKTLATQGLTLKQLWQHFCFWLNIFDNMFTICVLKIKESIRSKRQIMSPSIEHTRQLQLLRQFKVLLPSKKKGKLRTSFIPVNSCDLAPWNMSRNKRTRAPFKSKPSTAHCLASTTSTTPQPAESREIRAKMIIVLFTVPNLGVWNVGSKHQFPWKNKLKLSGSISF